MNEPNEAKNGATIVGIVASIGEVQTFGAKGFQKRAVVIALDGNPQYPQLFEVSFQGKNIDKADGISVGDSVIMQANLGGRRSDKQGPSFGRVFNECAVWSVKVTSKARTSSAAIDMSNDLPF